MKNAVKWIVLSLLLVAIIAVAAVLYNKYKEEYAPEMPEQKQTVTAPDFTVFDDEGNAVKLSDFKGSPVVINFWATWCYYCKQEMPEFEELYKKYPDVKFLMVNATDGVQETELMARQYIKEKGYTFDVYYDLRGEASYTYGVSGLPTTYFVDASGEIVAHAGGYLDEAALENGISKIRK